VTTRSWDPLTDLLILQERMNRLFEDSLGHARPRGTSMPTSAWAPLSDVYETADAYVLQIELPGVEERDIELHAEDDTLTIRGERRLTEMPRPESFHRMERSYGFFSRSFTFPQVIERDRVRSELLDGILTIEVPKSGEKSR
jgi:HSP20 family protein